MPAQPGTIIPCPACRQHGWHERWCVMVQTMKPAPSVRPDTADDEGVR